MTEEITWKQFKEAIEAGDLDKVKDLVENGNFDLNGPDWEQNEKPLIRAVISRSANLVEYLIEKGAKVDESEEVLYAACKMACSYDRLHGEDSGADDLRIIRCLLENGADPSFEKLNETPLDVVCSSSEGGHGKRLEIIKVLVETGAYDERIEDPGLSPVLSTCGLGEWAIDCFNYFTEKFPNLLENEDFRNHYLIHAANERQFGILEALLEAGADLNTVNKFGNSPLLMFASGHSLPVGHSFPKETAFVDCMRILIEKGADPLHKKREMESRHTGRVQGGDNLLHAILEGMPSETERRIEYGYDTAGKGREFFKELLEKGVSSDEKNKRVSGGGKTAKEMLIEKTLVEWLDCLKEFEGDDGSEPPKKVNFEEPSECRIYYGGINVLREYINIVLKDGDEIDGSRTAWEKGSFHFTWMLPRSLDTLLDTLAKGADWVHYFEDSYRKKWQSERPDIDYDECECLGGNGMSPGDYFFDSNDDYIDRESIAEFDDGWTGHTESIYFEANHRGNLTLRDEQGNWIRFDPMPNDYWKVSQGTSANSEKQPLHVDLVPGDEFDLIERVKQICGTGADKRKILLHRNGKTYGPYSRSSVERFLLENLASPQDWAMLKGEKEWVRLEDLLQDEQKNESEEVDVSDGEVIVNFKCPNLEAIIRETVDKPKGPITRSDLALLEELDGPELEITDPTGLEHATNLTSLALNSEQIKNLAFLANLSALKDLNLNCSALESLIGLENHLELETIILQNNSILENLDGLAKLPGLKSLAVHSCDSLLDIGALAELTGLESLKFGGHKITDFSPLVHLTNLSTLQIDSHFTDLAPLTGLTNLKYLELYNNQITNLTPLSGLVELVWLHLSANLIMDVTPLASLTALKDLELGKNQIADLAPLTSLTALYRLDIRENPITDFTPLTKMTNLRELYLRGNEIEDKHMAMVKKALPDCVISECIID